MPPRVSGTLKPVEYAGKNRFSKDCQFRGLNRPWSLAMKIFQTRLPPGKILDRGRKYSHWKAYTRFSWKKYQGNVYIAYESRKHIMVNVKWLWVMTKLQDRFTKKTAILKKRFLPTYFTSFKVPKTRGANLFYFFKTLLDGPLHLIKGS